MVASVELLRTAPWFDEPNSPTHHDLATPENSHAVDPHAAKLIILNATDTRQKEPIMSRITDLPTSVLAILAAHAGLLLCSPLFIFWPGQSGVPAPERIKNSPPSDAKKTATSSDPIHAILKQRDAEADAQEVEPKWSSLDNKIDLTYIPKVGDEAILGSPRACVVGRYGQAPGKLEIIEWRLGPSAVYTSFNALSEAMKPAAYDGLIDTYDPSPPISMLQLRAGVPVTLTARYNVITRAHDETLLKMPAFEALVSAIGESKESSTAVFTNTPLVSETAHLIRNSDHPLVTIKVPFSSIYELVTQNASIDILIDGQKMITLTPYDHTYIEKFIARIVEIRNSVTPASDEQDIALLGGAPPAVPRAISNPPEPQREMPTISILDSSWDLTPSRNYINVSCMIRNLSHVKLKSLTATIIYKDRNGKLVRSDDTLVGNLGPGETTTFKTMDAADDRIHYYSIQFNADVDGETV